MSHINQCQPFALLCTHITNKKKRKKGHTYTKAFQYCQVVVIKLNCVDDWTRLVVKSLFFFCLVFVEQKICRNKNQQRRVEIIVGTYDISDFEALLFFIDILSCKTLFDKEKNLLKDVATLKCIKRVSNSIIL